MKTERPPRRNAFSKGKTPTEARAEITALFHVTSDGAAFAAALDKAGYRLVRTTRKVVQVVDSEGGAHTLLTRIAAPAEAIEKRLAEIPPDWIIPKKTRERETRVILQCTPGEKVEIDRRAAQAGLSVSGYLRALVFGADTPQPRAARRVPVEAEVLQRLLAEFGKIGSNLNQIARRLNQDLGFDAPIFAEVSAELRMTIRALLEALGREPTLPAPPSPRRLADKLFKRKPPT